MHVLNERVLVEEVKEENKTESGLILASSNKDFSKPTKSAVIDVADGIKSIKVGDEILYMPRAGISFEKDENTNYRILKEEDILAIV